MPALRSPDPPPAAEAVLCALLQSVHAAPSTIETDPAGLDAALVHLLGLAGSRRDRPGGSGRAAA